MDYTNTSSSGRKITIATIQLNISWDIEENLNRIRHLFDEASKNHAQLVVLPELISAPYFCKAQNSTYFKLAETRKTSRFIQCLSELARKHRVVIPASYFEKAGPCFFNAMVMIDANGTVMDNYRKSHIPDGPGYCEKFYFSPGDTGFKVWQTHYGIIGAGICWDQWFPEQARMLALNGAEIIVYPTAIGSEPQDPTLDSAKHWQRVMQGHAAANMLPVVAANRTGKEIDDGVETLFYGSSFITNHTGEILAEAPRHQESIIYAELDLAAIAEARNDWGLFRDRRPDLYHPLTSLTGE